jgi:hypothetical protein
MRLIERQMIDAIKQGKDWCKDNTKVVQFYNDEDYPVITSVFLHGNKIAEIDATTVEIYDGGWQSNTTKSRLNALINGLCDGYKCGVYQRKFEWFIMDNDETVEFEHGYTFSRV